MSNKQLTKNLIFNSISFLLNFIISFFFTPYLIRVVGKEAYSFFPLVNNIINYSSIITVAVGSMVGRLITMSIYKGDIKSANGFFNSVWIANVFLSVIFSLISILGIVYISKILTIPNSLIYEVQILFGFTSISLILGLITGLFGIGSFVKNRIDMQASRQAVSSIIRVVCIVLLFWLFKPSIVYMSLSALIASVFNVYFNISLKNKLLPELTFFPTKYFKWDYLKITIFSGIWNSINQLSNVLLQQFDLLITNIFIGVAATGDYSIAKTAPTLILNFLAMLSGTFAPHFNILYAKGKIKELINEVKKSMMLISLLIGIPIGFLLVYSQEFYQLWMPEQDSNILYWLTFITILPMICGGSVNPIFGIFSTTNKLRTPSIVLLVAGILNTVIILILLKTTDLGIWSIPFVGAIQSILRNTLFTTMYGAHCLNQKLTIFFPTLFKGIIGMCIVMVVGIVLKSFYSISNWGDFFISLTFIAFTSLLINSFIILAKHDRKVLYNLILAKVKL